MATNSPDDSARTRASAEDLASQVDGAVGEALSALLQRAAQSHQAYAPELGAALAHAVDGGKRFRALAAAVGAAAAFPGGSLRSVMNPSLLALGAALELYQAAALVHDDVIDRSQERRGRPALHKELRDWHLDRQLGDSAEHFGTSAAILAGDFLLAAAHSTIQRAASAGSAPARVAERFSLLEAEVAYGQYLDLQASQTGLADADAGASVGRALEVIRLKSARYSVVHPVVLGALHQGAQPSLVHWLERIFEPVGLAFQLRDDHLGVFGDQAATGKPTGSDIRERKRTVLLALTAQSADASARDQLTRIYGRSGQPTAVEVETVRDIVDTFGRPAHERLIDEYRIEGRRVLAAAPLPREAKEASSHLIDLLVDRAH